MHQPRFAAGTIVARNYLAQARTLARSFGQHHPDIPFSTLIVDGTEADRDQPGVGEVVLPSDLRMAADALESMMTIYDVMEFATALKPAFLAELMRHDRHAVAYFDPDVRFYAPIADVFESAREHGVMLTPHALYPLPRDGRHLSESAIMHAGIYNLGFIAVGATAYTFLSWWHERLRTDAIVDLEQALFTDQRWIDWVPALFPHTISRDQGLNAAYWNLHERKIVRDGDGFRAGDYPLRFFHFSGYDPERPWLLSKHMGDRPRTLLSEEPALQSLCDGYRDELLEFGHPTLRRSPYGLDTLANGLRLAPRVRKAVRQLMLQPMPGVAPPPPAYSEPEAFTEWLLVPQLGGSHPLSVAQWSIWRERPDLRAYFPDVLASHGESFHTWCSVDPATRDWLAELGSVAEATRAAHAPQAASLRAFGWSVIAYADSELGVGEAGRRVAEAVRATGLPMEVVGTQLGSRSRKSHRTRGAVGDRVGFENTITCVNADMVPHLSASMGLSLLRGRQVGLWFWELEEFPSSLSRSFNYLHEVWTVSEFTRDALQRATDKPVRLVTLPIEPARHPTRFTRRSIGLPEDRFVFLTNFDYFSVYERKNPIGVIKAYLAAFGPDDGATLVIKSINGDARPLDREHVRSFAQFRPDIVFLDEYVTSVEMKAMIELSDCYVSLHRAEGYGLNLADAFAVGTPTIATGYSGNLSFMTQENSLLIDYELIDVGDNSGPYDPRARWADPRLDAAAAAMRAVFDDRALGDRLTAQALADVRAHHSLAVAASILRGELLGTVLERRSA